MATPEEMLAQAIEAARSGDKVTARRLLSETVRLSPREARAWYLLSQLVEQPERAEICLQKVLDIDPQNAKARQRLEALKNGTWAPGNGPTNPKPVQAPPPQAGPPSWAPEPAGETEAAGAAQPVNTSPGVQPAAKPVLPPWLAIADGDLPEEPLPLLPARPEIPSYASSYVPPSIPGVVDETAAGAKIDPKFAKKPAPVKTKHKRDFFGIVVIVATIGVLIIILACGAFYYLSNRVTSNILGVEQMPVPAAASYKITYRLEGSGAAQVIYTNGQREHINKKVYLPWWSTMDMPAGSMPTLTASLLDSKQSFRCVIEVNGQKWKQNTSRANGVVSCFGILADY